MQKRAKKWGKMLPNEVKSPQSKNHVAVGRNIRVVMQLSTISSFIMSMKASSYQTEVCLRQLKI